MQAFSSFLNLAVAGASVDLCRIGAFENDKVCFTVKNTGTHPLTAFEVWARVHPLDSDMKIASAAGDYTSPSGLILLAKKSDNTALDFTILAAGIEGLIIVDTRGIESILLKATAAAPANNTTLNIYANGGV